MDCIWIGACGARQARPPPVGGVRDEHRQRSAVQVWTKRPTQTRSDRDVRGAMVDVVHGLRIVQ